MNIQYYGRSCFKITTKPAGRATEDVVIFIDPFDKSVGLRPPQGQANVIFVSHHHRDHDNVLALKGDPTVIDTPGEYSIKGINATGIDAYHDNKEGALHGHTILFNIESEDLKVCHLGDLGEDLSSEKLEALNGVDVLFIPIGGLYTIDGKKAAEIARKIEPAIVIPMHYKMGGAGLDLENEQKFCREMGNCPKEKVAKFSIKKKDLEGKSMEVILMSVNNAE